MLSSEPLLGSKKSADSKKSLRSLFLVLGLLSLGCVLLYNTYHDNDQNTLSNLHNQMETLDEQQVTFGDEMEQEITFDDEMEQETTFDDQMEQEDQLPEQEMTFDDDEMKQENLQITFDDDDEIKQEMIFDDFSLPESAYNDDDIETVEVNMQTFGETYTTSFTSEISHVNHIANVQPESACGLAYERGIGTIPDKCKSGYVKNAGFCYKNPCPSGYTTVAASCIQNCPKGYTDIGVTCVAKALPKPKAEYSRKASEAGCGSDAKLHLGLCYNKDCREDYKEDGPIRCAKCGSKWKFFAGKTMCKKKKSLLNVKPSQGYLRKGNIPKCPADKPVTAKVGTIRWCYPKCKSGYKSISGWGCQKPCEKGQTDLGALCQDKDLIKTKDVKVRKPYVPTGCGDDKVNQAGLCYKKCKPGYTGIGPICFLNLQKFAKKKGEEFAQYFKAFNIYQGKNCFDTKIEELKSQLVKLDFKKKDVGKQFMNILKGALKTQSFSQCLKKKVEQWQAAGLWDFRHLAFAVEYSIGASFGFSVGGFIGFAIAPTYNGGVLDFSADGIKLLGYFGGCIGFSIDGGVPSGDIGADFTFVVYRSLGDILGNAYAFGVSVEVNSCVGGELSVGPVVALAASNCQVVGIGLSVGASLSTPGCPGSLSVEMSWCRAEKFGSISFDEQQQQQEQGKRHALLYGEKVPVNNRVQQAFTEDGPVEFFN